MSKFGFDKVLKDFEGLKKKLPVKIGNDAKNFFVSSFAREGWEGEAFVRWRPRTAYGKVKKKDQGRNLLVKSGRLRRSIANSLKTATFDRIAFSTDVPYAFAHNYGFRGMEYVKPYKRQYSRTVRIKGSYSGLGDERRRAKKVKMLGARSNVKGFSRRMNIPARKFMGSSLKLDRTIEKRIVDEINKIWK